MVCPDTKHDLTVEVADIQAFQNIFTIKVRRL
jgi:hypothetical protein